MSAGPPGPNGTTMRTGLLGQLCAAAGSARAATAAIDRPSLVAQRMDVLPSDGGRLYVDLRRKRAMDRTLIRDLKQTRALLGVEHADEFDRPVDAVDQRLGVLAVDTILGMGLAVLQPHHDLLERP